jgi:4-diphosphocytidyl-2-C-methyl-D-erythritol kinase
MTTEDMTIEAPCKINLHLRVGDRRPDGYHDLESVFLALAFGDTLKLECAGDDGACVIEMSPPLGEGLPPKKNLIYRAVTLFRGETGFRQGLRVYLEKRIPMGAGLGGGSSDAASVLMALDALAGTGLSCGVLERMALELGSDVPFFLHGGAAFVSGRGERIEPLVAPEGLWVLLVYPGFPSNTGEAFRHLDKDRPAARSASPGREALIRALAGPPGAWPYCNDFLPVFLAGGGREAAVYRSVLEDLAGLGADFCGLSGSGSVCFGVFVDRLAAERAEKTLSEQGSGMWVRLTFSLRVFTRGY